MVSLRITSITSSGGETIDIPDSGVTCIVGSNNVGKSRFLRDIRDLLTQATANSATVGSVNIRLKGDTEEAVLAWLEGNYAKNLETPGNYFAPFSGGEWIDAHGFYESLTANDVGEDVTVDSEHGMGFLGRFFIHHTGAGSLAEFSSQQIGHPQFIGPEVPLADVYADGDLEAELARLAERHFDTPLVLDRANGIVSLRVGRVTSDIPTYDRPSKAYARELRAMPPLADQGDGLKSFLGLAILLMTKRLHVLLVDEPEAFLHPAQARALGRWLANDAAERGAQVIVATHDRDLVLGMVESESSAEVTIVRVAREGNRNHLTQLRSDKVRTVWNDPVHRYSNVLQGLFHRRVVICESDSDCRFFGAALDYLGESTDRRVFTDDVLFVPSGGKDRIPKVAHALTGLKVEAVALIDFDALDSKSLIRSIVDQVSEGWTADMESAWRTFANAMNGGNLWSKAKNLGINVVPAGEATEACERLLVLLRAANVLVVPIGEMEDFDRSIIRSHGADWVSGALEKGLHTTSADVHDFLKSIIEVTK
jgi:ABC-type cobalamin/Fe3+-siderophores transport system ATPase subunit